MQKKNVLGTDPLSWLKEKDKKENPENTERNMNDQKKLADKKLEPKDIDGISAKSKIQAAKITDVSNTEEASKKSKYKPVGVSTTNNLQEEKTDEPNDETEAHRRKVSGEEAYSYHARTREVTQKESPATMFVIAYTVLLIILGFLVYRDLTKQIDILNTKLTNLEKKVDAGMINYEDTKVNDVW